MAITIVCPGCHKRFSVSDNFAGQSGPCPKCKTVIKIPEKSTEVKVHAPTEFAEGGRGVDGKLVTKPIARKDTKLSTLVIACIVGSVLLVPLVTWAFGSALQQMLIVRAVGLLIISPPLVWAAYTFLRNDELEAYKGKSLLIRVVICALSYALLWAIFGYATERFLTGDVWSWIVLISPFVAIGALAAYACLDLDFGSGVCHYAFYVIITSLLRWIAGMGWLWEMANDPAIPIG